MSDAKTKLKVGDVVDVVATAIGYRNNRMVSPGVKFKIAVTKGKDGEPRLPKWVRLASEPAVQQTPRKGGDLKPLDAQAALKQKAAQLTGEQPPDAPGDNLA